MITEIIGAVAGVAAGAGGGAVRSMPLSPPGGGSPDGVSAVKFKDAMANASMNATVSGPSPAMQAVFSSLDQVNSQARAVSDFAAQAEASGGSLSPGEIVQLTMRCNEFMFQCQLTSNIANRSSDGVQQLFRQQG